MSASHSGLTQFAPAERLREVVRRELPLDERQVARSPGILEKIKGLILLGGSVRASALQNGIKRSLLNLPIRGGETLLEGWKREAALLMTALPAQPLKVRVILDRSAVEPNVPAADDCVAMSVERDPIEFRGSGGVLRDIAKDYQPDDFLVIANAAQVLFEPLLKMTRELAAKESDIAMVSHENGVPSGLMLVRCGCLAQIAETGFVDMKEQALPALALKHRVSVISRTEPTGLPIRTLGQYIQALRHYHRSLAGDVNADDPFHEDWKASFALIEEGAQVHPKARVRDSVVLRGARVEDGAVVVGSVIGEGAVVRRGRMVVDEIIS